MKNFALKLSAMVFALACTFVACSSNNSDDGLAGTVTDTGNTLTMARIMGSVALSDGDAATGVIVRMATVLADTDSVVVPKYVETETDSLGLFSFDSVLADTFQLAVIDTVSSEIFYLPRAVVGVDTLDSIKLEKAAVFSSVLYYEQPEDSSVTLGSHFKVFIPGTPFFKSVFAGDSFNVLIPAGTWWFGFCPGDVELVAKLEETGVPDTVIYRTWSMDGKVDAGDTLVAGPFIWSPKADVDSLVKEELKEAEIVTRISGQVYCKSGRACAGVEVQLITDLYGFEFVEGDSTGFVGQTVTDSLGRWYLPLPAEVPYDSFRVEYRLLDADSVTSQTGLSRYVKASEIKDLKDTLSLGKDTLTRPSGLHSGVFLVVDKQDTTQSNNCMVNSVVVGIKGTSHFIREVTCNKLEIESLPSGEQEIVLYSGDTKVVKTLQDSNVSLDKYLTFTSVVLPQSDILEEQWMTYTPPTVK